MSHRTRRCNTRRPRKIPSGTRCRRNMNRPCPWSCRRYQRNTLWKWKRQGVSWPRRHDLHPSHRSCHHHRRPKQLTARLSCMPRVKGPSHRAPVRESGRPGTQNLSCKPSPRRTSSKYPHKFGYNALGRAMSSARLTAARGNLKPHSAPHQMSIPERWIHFGAIGGGIFHGKASRGVRHPVARGLVR